MRTRAMKPIMVVGLLLALFPSIGCGTLKNVGFTPCSGSKPANARIYGGVESELVGVVDLLHDTNARDYSVSEKIEYFCLFPILILADLPLSFAADTVTLPLVIGVQIERYLH